MEDNKIIDNLMSILTTEDLWFTQKTDPTFGEAPDYFKLDEYGDLKEKQKLDLDKEAREIKEAISKSLNRDSIDFQTRWATGDEF